MTDSLFSRARSWRFFAHVFRLFFVVFWSKALQRELEALASTLVMRPVQPKSWPLFEAIDLAWRVPAVVLFLLFMGKESDRKRGVWPQQKYNLTASTTSYS